MKSFYKLSLLLLTLLTFQLSYAAPVNVNNMHSFVFAQNFKTHSLFSIPFSGLKENSKTLPTNQCASFLRGTSSAPTYWSIQNICSQGRKFYVGWNGGPPYHYEYCFHPGQIVPTGLSIYQYSPTSDQEFVCTPGGKCEAPVR